MTISAFLDMKKLKETKASGGNFNYFKAGYEGLVQISDVKFDRKQIGGAVYFAVSSKIITTNMPEVVEMRIGQTGDYYVPGDKSWYLNNIQSFIQALLGVSQPDVDAMLPDQFATVVSNLLDGEKPAAIGEYMWVRCVGGITKTGPRAGQPNAVTRFMTPTTEQLASAGIRADA